MQRWSQWEGVTGLCLGFLIGALIGIVSGYLQGSKVHSIRGGIVGGLVGAIAGSVGISVGSVVFAFAQKLPLVGLAGGVPARALGWGMMGVVIGLAEGGVGLSLKRAYYGLIGGLLGGVLGGALFEVAAMSIGTAQASFEGGPAEVGTVPRAIGFAVLGAGIGLMIGVVEALSRKAWVRLILGRNEGKDWSLDAPVTVLGSSESAHIPLRGDPNVTPQHACIRNERGQYVIYDMNTPIGIAVSGVPTRQAILRPGEFFQIGQHLLQFNLRGHAASASMPGSVPAPGQVPMLTMPPAPIPTPTAPTVAMPAAAPAPTQLSIVAVTGPMTGQRFPVTQVVELGREGGSIPLSWDTHLSRKHARIEPAEQQLRLVDLASTNGTMVNGQRIADVLLKPGDRFTIGSTTFLIE